MPRHSKGAAALSLIVAVGLVGVSAVILRQGLRATPPSDFSDIYLVGVTALAYRYTWKIAAALAFVTLAVSAYVLAPLDTPDFVEMGSYAVCAGVCLWIMARLKRRTS